MNSSIHNSSIHIGPFALLEPVGEGGMGRVYRAVHRRTGVEVAVKVMAGRDSRQSADRFHREVQAHAGLVHPGIVYLFDYGEVGPEISESLGGELPERSPYVAMELADRGTVRDAMPVDDWATARELLIQTLDALAFSHARGVIHRDLKPENLLLFGDERELHVKLADFGIAYAFDDVSNTAEEELRSFAGTPHYMAPEQLRSRWRDYGPWTDLYALGCIGWELVCGRPPFRADSPVNLAMLHTETDRPALQPRFPVPDRFEQWVHRAMSIAPPQRFRFAADAVRKLSEMDEQIAEATGVHRGETGRGDTADWSGPTRTFTLAATVTMRTMSKDEELDDDGPDAAKMESAEEHPIPETWSTSRIDHLPAPLVGAGQGLFGLREVPFVDRAVERDRLWSGLLDVAERQRPRAVLLVGDRGVGKSRLAEALATRAHEVGAARLARMTHSPGAGGVMDGVSGMLRRAFGMWNSTREECHQRLLERLPPLGDDEQLRKMDARALAELMHPARELEEGPEFRISDPEQKRLLFRRLFLRFTHDRATVTWFDDLQWGDDAVEIVDELLEIDEELPAFVVATVRSDVLAERPEIEERIRQLQEHPRCERFELEPLSGADQREMVDQMLPLTDRIAASLTERTEGNPLFAQQLLGDWISSGQLEVTDDGFDVAGDNPLSVPEDIQQLWIRRLSRLVKGASPGRTRETFQVLELAAALGREVDEQEWQTACRRTNLRIPVGLVDAMIDRGLAQRTERGWKFAHGMLVDTLEQHAREKNRRRRHHRSCALILETRQNDHDRGTAGRRADHWIEAGEPERAIEPMYRESRALVIRGGFARALRILDRRQALLDELGFGPLSVERIKGEVTKANIRFRLADIEDPEEFEAHLHDILEQCRAVDEPRLVARMYRALGVWARHTDTVEVVKDYHHRAVDSARQTDDPVLEARMLLALGWMHHDAGEIEDAGRCARKAGAIFDDIDGLYEKSICDALQGWTALASDDYETATEQFERLVDHSEATGIPMLAIYGYNGLGDVARFRGDYDRALEFYERHLKLNRQIRDHQLTDSALLNLTQNALLAGEIERAEECLEEAERQMERVHGHRWAESWDFNRLVLAAVRGRWERFDVLFEEYRDGWSADRPVIRDLPQILELAADHAVEAAEYDRAVEVLTLVKALWDRLGEQDASARVDERISRLADEAKDNTHTP